MTALKRDTALVFDLENVVDGYGAGLGARLERVSVPDIVDRITEVGRESGLITVDAAVALVDMRYVTSAFQTWQA